MEKLKSIMFYSGLFLLTFIIIFVSQLPMIFRVEDSREQLKNYQNVLLKEGEREKVMVKDEVFLKIGDDITSYSFSQKKWLDVK